MVLGTGKNHGADGVTGGPWRQPAVSWYQAGATQNMAFKNTTACSLQGNCFIEGWKREAA
jgi:hypothetical protein